MTTPSGAMIYGTDAVSTAPDVDLPTGNDYWFTDGNGSSVPGTQVPDYWVNKVGGEIGAAIVGLGATLSMTNRGQLLALLQAMQVTEFSLTTPGYIVWPFGITEQWGYASLNNGSSFQATVSVALPIPWANGFLNGLAVDSGLNPKSYTCYAGSDLSHVNVACPRYYLEGASGVITDRSTLSSFTSASWRALGY
jgi:hypothetical protein